jgi:outer membrane receptor for ferric coprogen and ferric-rhodotorulic acid
MFLPSWKEHGSAARLARAKLHTMQTRILSIFLVAIVAICFCGAAFAADGRRTRHTTGWKSERARALARDPYADPAAPYKANRLSSSRERIINIPSQTTVITRSVMDDKNVTSIGGALRSTPGVTVGR